MNNIQAHVHMCGFIHNPTVSVSVSLWKIDAKHNQAKIASKGLCVTQMQAAYLLGILPFKNTTKMMSTLSLESEIGFISQACDIDLTFDQFNAFLALEDKTSYHTDYTD